MNQAAIERTVEIIERMDKLLRRKLTEKQLSESDNNIGFNAESHDKHIRRILGADYLGCSDSENVSASEATEIIDRLASLCGKSAAEVGKILWLYCEAGYGAVCTVQSPKCWLCDASEFCARAQQDQKYARLLDDDGHALFRIELKKLYELWIPGESEEYEYIHVKRSRTHPEYVIIVMTTASDQAGIVAVADMASGEIVHYHDGEYAMSAEIYKEHVITIRGVHYWGIKPYNCVDAVKFGTKENISSERQIKIEDSIGDDFTYTISDDAIQFKDSSGRTCDVGLSDIIGE